MFELLHYSGSYIHKTETKPDLTVRYDFVTGKMMQKPSHTGKQLHPRISPSNVLSTPPQSLSPAFELRISNSSIPQGFALVSIAEGLATDRGSIRVVGRPDTASRPLLRSPLEGARGPRKRCCADLGTRHRERVVTEALQGICKVDPQRPSLTRTLLHSCQTECRWRLVVKGGGSSRTRGPSIKDALVHLTISPSPTCGVVQLTR